MLVPKYVFEKLGTMDARYSHSFGDYDYGIRALKAGITSVVSPGILAECDRNPSLPKWRDASFSVKERYRSLMSLKEDLSESSSFMMREVQTFSTPWRILSPLI